MGNVVEAPKYLKCKKIMIILYVLKSSDCIVKIYLKPFKTLFSYRPETNGDYQKHSSRK